MSVFDLIPWWTYLVGAFGVAGTVALIVFAPAIAMALWQGALKIAYRVLQTRIGCALLAAALAWPAGYFYGGIVAEQKCRARDVRAAEQARQRDETQEKRAGEDEKKDEGELERIRKELKEATDAYEKLLAARKIGACTITPDDLPRRR